MGKLERFREARRVIEVTLMARAKRERERVAQEEAKATVTQEASTAEQFEDAQNLQRFNEYKENIFAFLQDANNEVLGGQAKVMGWRITRSAHLHEEYYPSSWDGINQFPYATWTHETEQLEIKVEMPNTGAVGVALITNDRIYNSKGVNLSKKVERANSFGYIRPQKVHVEYSTSTTKPNSIGYCNHRGGASLSL